MSVNRMFRPVSYTHLLFLTTFSDDEYIVRALRMGAKGYLIKQAFESILPALRAVHAGQSVFGGEVMGRLPGLMQSGGGLDYAARGLSERERDVIEPVSYTHLLAAVLARLARGKEDVTLGFAPPDGTGAAVRPLGGDDALFVLRGKENPLREGRLRFPALSHRCV